MARATMSPARPLVSCRRCPGRDACSEPLRRSPSQPAGAFMQTFLISTATVALAEIGDKTQLLSLILAAKYRKPWPICFGIFAATLANHGIAGEVGALVASYLTPEVVKWVTAISFLSVALWTLKPDQADDAEAARGARYGVFLATVIAFFIAEMGDKTQVATVVLAAQYR